MVHLRIWPDGLCLWPYGLCLCLSGLCLCGRSRIRSRSKIGKSISCALSAVMTAESAHLWPGPGRFLWPVAGAGPVPRGWISGPDRVYINGGAIAPGHPIGASGARIALHLVHEPQRRGGGLGAAGLCGGGGQGEALIIRVPAPAV